MFVAFRKPTTFQSASIFFPKCLTASKFLRFNNDANFTSHYI